MKNLFYFVSILIVIFFVRCNYIDNVYWKEGDYIITSNPVIPDCKSLYNIDHGRVDFVTKIGANENFIIIESKDQILEYWIINKTKDNQLKNPNEIVEGPFDSKEFIKIKAQKRISSLKFEEVF